MIRFLLPISLVLSACQDLEVEEEINEPPYLLEITVEPSDGPATNEQIVCIATASDPNGDSLSIDLEWMNDTTNTSLGTTNVIELNNDIASPDDVLTCSVIFDDGKGGNESDSDSLVVINTDPTIDELTITPNTDITTSASLYCSAVASDIDGGDPNINYIWNNLTTGASVGVGHELEITPSLDADPDFSVGDIIKCEVSATDGDGGSSTADSSIQIANTDPTIDSIEILPSEGVEYDTVLSCAASASDADLETPTLSYQWTSGDVELGVIDTLQLVEGMVEPGDEVTCTVTATDSHGGTGVVNTMVSVENTTPTWLDEAVIDELNVFTGTTLTCSADAYDPNDGALSVEYTWTGGSETIEFTGGGSDTGIQDTGAPQPQTFWPATGQTIALSVDNSDVGDEITCTAYAIDSNGEEIESISTVTVQNSVPHVDVATIDPNPAYATDTLSCTPTDVDDLDGDEVTLGYSWLLNSVIDATQNESTYSGSLSANDSITCTITPNDGNSDGQGVSDTVQILNTVPSIDGLDITPDPAYTTDSLAVSTTTSDPDASQSLDMAYHWTVGGVEVDEVTASLDSAHFEKNEQVVVTVTVTDGAAEVVSSKSITISNSLPVLAPIVALDSDGQLLCSAEPTDADADSLTSSVTWTLNDEVWVDGTATTNVAGDTIAVDHLVGNLHWTCHYLSSDGEGSTTKEVEYDADGDGFTPLTGDCDESDPDVNPSTASFDDADCDDVDDSIDASEDTGSSDTGDAAEDTGSSDTGDAAEDTGSTTGDDTGTAAGDDTGAAVEDTDTDDDTGAAVEDTDTDDDTGAAVEDTDTATGG
jgi:hypothetical protein